MEILKGVHFGMIGVNGNRTNQLGKVGSQPQRVGRVRTLTCCKYSPGTAGRRDRYDGQPQNVDLPEIHPKNKKKPFPVPIKKMLQTSRQDKRLAQMSIEKPLEAPKNGLLVPELVPVAFEVLDNWKVLIRGLSQLLNVVTVYGCRLNAQLRMHWLQERD